MSGINLDGVLHCGSGTDTPDLRIYTVITPRFSTGPRLSPTPARHARSFPCSRSATDFEGAIHVLEMTLSTEACTPCALSPANRRKCSFPTLTSVHTPSSERAEGVGAKRADAFADLSFMSAAAISAGCNSAAARQVLAIRCACCPQYWHCRENLTVSRFRLRSRFRPRARANDRLIPFVARPMATYRFGSAAC